MTLNVRYKKLHPDAVEPKRGSTFAAGYDVTAVSYEWDYANKVMVYHTGLAFEIPSGYVGLLFTRSSIYRKDMALTNCVGVLDSDYRGEVLFKYALRYHTGREKPVIYEVGERIGQLVVMPVPHITFFESDSLTETERGANGYGSTGA